MRKIRKAISCVCMLIASAFMMGPVMAGSQDFSGPYVMVKGGANGAMLRGQYQDSDGQITQGTSGAVFPTLGGEIGYNIPVGDTFVIAIGASLDPLAANITKANDAADEADMKINIEDLKTFYVQPSFSFSESSMVYAKMGVFSADIRCTVGAICANDIVGTNYALGTVAKFGNGLFMKAEAGAHFLDKIKISNIGSSNGDEGSEKGKLTAHPNIAYGSVGIGYNF